MSDTSPVDTRSDDLARVPGRAVVVGVDGSRDSEGAVAWAANEAERLGCRLLVVTATGETALTSPLVMAGKLVGFDYTAYYEGVVDDEKSRLAKLRPDLEVDVEVHHGDPVSILASMAVSARLVVVGRQGLGAAQRLLLGSTSMDLARRCHGPVVVVPAGWHDSTRPSAAIVVGVDPHRDSSAAIEFAIKRASSLGRLVTVVYGWQFHPDVLLTEPDRARRLVDARRALEQWLDPCRDRHPTVEINAIVHDAHPVDALVDETSRAGMVVVGRRKPPRDGLGFGATIRGVLHYSTQPVVVVPNF